MYFVTRKDKSLGDTVEKQCFCRLFYLSKTEGFKMNKQWISVFVAAFLKLAGLLA